MNGPPGMAMNSAVGVPVGGSPLSMQQPNNADQGQDLQQRLNTYIYDHFLKTKQFELARQFRANNVVRVREKGKPNGVSTNDPKDGPKKPDDLPEAELPPQISESSFLLDWFCMFWDTFHAARGKPTFRTLSTEYVVRSCL
jgi:hypothetical protein